MSTMFTLESGINVPSWINLAPGTFGKTINIAPWINVAPSQITNNLNLLYTAKGKES